MRKSANNFALTLPEFNQKFAERRENPRVYCHLKARLKNGSSDRCNDYMAVVYNISSGGLAFSIPLDDGPEFTINSYQKALLSIHLPTTEKEIVAQGPILRVDTNGRSLQAALKYELLENEKLYEEFLKRASQRSISHFFLTSHFGSSLKDNKVLRFAQAKKLFERVQRVFAGDVYTFQQQIEEVRGAQVLIDGRWKIMMSSYSYLGLLNDPRITEATIEAIKTYGTGASGVRLLTGTTKLHRSLEKSIALLKNTEEAVVYSSGYMSNQAVIASIFGKRDYIIADYLAHQSIFDACQLAGSVVVKFKHNDMSDLENKLADVPREKRKLIVTDAVFSMDGDVAPLPDIVKLAKKYNALTMIDEAHAIGVMGTTGRGIDEHFGLAPGEIDIYMGTFSKAIPSCGGYIAGSNALIYYLKHASNPFIFSAALSPAETAAATKALEILREEPWRVTRVRENINYFSKGLKQMGYKLINSESAIIALLIGDDETTCQLSSMMNEKDVFVCPVLFPAVPITGARIRNCLLASHTREQLDHVLNAYEEVGKALQLI